MHRSPQAKNHEEGSAMQIECIEPYPHDKLSDIPGIVVHREEVRGHGTRSFLGLGKGDVLFIDSAHVLKITAMCHIST
jgi:hypothetical protein